MNYRQYKELRMMRYLVTTSVGNFTEKSASILKISIYKRDEYEPDNRFGTLSNNIFYR